MFLAILTQKKRSINGAKLSQNIFHFESTAIFFKIGQFTKLFQISVVSLSYDASGKKDTSLLKIKEIAIGRNPHAKRPTSAILRSYLY